MARVSRLLGGPSRRGVSRAVAFTALALVCCAIGGALADGEDDAIDSVDPDDDSFPTSEDVPLWQFETEVVTIGKASGKERGRTYPPSSSAATTRRRPPRGASTSTRCP